MQIDFVVNKGRHFTGLSSYSYNLKKELSKKIILREVDTNRRIPMLLSGIGKLLSIDIKTFLGANPLWIPSRKNSIIHLTTQNFTLPLLFRKYKCVVTVHDVIQFEHGRKELFVGKKASLLNRILMKLELTALKNASRIIADSGYTKKRIAEIARYPPAKIDVVPLGIDGRVFKLQKIRRDPFTVLYVGSEMPRKNLHVLIRAFAKLKRRLPEAKLVKIGMPQWPGSRRELKRLITELGISDSVIFKDYRRDLAPEYAKATLFVHPSIYEGFGLPILEAMACGCAVICSSKTSLPEVAGDAAIYFDGYDEDDLERKIYKLLVDDKSRAEFVKNHRNL